MADLDEALLALVGRFGRRGINEAVIWSMLRVEVPGLAVPELAGAVDRMVADGRLYRHRRRTRTMIQACDPQKAPTQADEGHTTLF